MRNQHRRYLEYVPLLICLMLTAIPVPVRGQGPEVSGAVEEATESISPFEEEMPHLDLSDRFPEWAQEKILGVALWEMLAAFLFIFFGLAAMKISDYVFKVKIIPMLRKTRWSADNLTAQAASAPIGFLLFILGLGSAFAVLPLPTEPNVSGFSYGIIKILLVLDLIWFLFRCVDSLAKFLRHLSEQTDSKIDQQIVPLVRKSLKVTVAIICGVWVLQLFGYSVSSLIAGLGIGGLAVALAVQDPLSNFFGSVFLFLDKPFVVGDWVKINDVEGIVEEVGFRTSQVRTWPKSLVTIPNKTVAAAAIENFTKMSVRMNVQNIGVTYEATPDQLEEIVQKIKQYLADQDDLAHDLTIVRFTEFGECCLNILVRFYTIPLGYDDYLATRERINLAIMRIVRGMGLSLAYPTRSIYLEGNVSKALTRYFDKQSNEEEIPE